VTDIGDSIKRARRPRRNAGVWRPVFLRVLRNTANVSTAARLVGVHRSVPYRWRRRDQAFRAEWDYAIDDACDLLEAAARERALAGSTVLLMFLLKAYRPHLYRETSRRELRIEDRIRAAAAEEAAIAKALADGATG
jgi:transposase-like protein